MKLFNIAASGSPIQARNSNMPVALWFVLIAAGVIGIFFVIRTILHQMKQRKLSPEWLAKEKKRITQKKDVDVLAEKLKLPHDEVALLWSICKNTKAPNITYLIDENGAEELDRIFKSEYLAMKARNADNDQITLLFRIRHKLEEAAASTLTITSTNALSEGIKFICYLESGQQVPCTVVKITKDSIFLDIPQALYDSPDRPKELAKATFTFNFPSITRYEFSARIVRYNINTKGTPELIISHSNNLSIQAKRGSRRVDYIRHTFFYAVTQTEEGGKKKFVRKDKAYKCSLLNVSGDGCCISSDLPIKQNQYVCIDVPINDTTENVVGRIVDTRRLDQKLFALHIAFVQIDPSFKNEIFALAYNYVDA